MDYRTKAHSGFQDIPLVSVVCWVSVLLPLMPYFILTHCSAPPESLAEPVKSQEPVARGEDPEVCAGANVDNSGGGANGGEEKVDQKLSNTEKE